MSLAQQIQALVRQGPAPVAPVRRRQLATSLMMEQREAQIVEYMADGHWRTARELAEHFEVTTRTITSHLVRLQCRRSKVGEITYYALPV